MELEDTFKNREEAGRLIAEEIKKLKLRKPLILAIPRGGIIVANEIARAIKAELGVVTPRKLKAPSNQELAIGAIMPDGSTYLNQEVIARLSIASQIIESERESAKIESTRRLNMYLKGKRYPKIKKRDVLLVDDGIATGATMIVAARWVRKEGANKIIIAAPVLPQDTIPILRMECDELIYLEAPELFFAIGQFYREFDQVDDEKVLQILESKR